MAELEQLDLLMRGVTEWNSWRIDNPSVIVDLSGADLSGVDLSRADLSDADLSGADLSGADLSGADLSGANLIQAKTGLADFTRVTVTHATRLPALDRSHGVARGGSDLPGVTVLPGPTPSWIVQATPVVGKVFGNAQRVANFGPWRFRRSIANAPACAVGAPPTLQELIGLYPGPVVGGDVVHTEEGYRAIFTQWLLPLPDLATTYRTAGTFAESFVSGPDPTRLVRMNSVPGKFPISSEHLASVPELGAPQLDTAMAAGRVYWIDYALTGDLTTGMHTDGTTMKHMYSPMIAFCVTTDGSAALPFAIQCGQDPAGRQIYTPEDGYSWLLARNCVAVAHHTVHEALTHLTNTHLVAGRVMESAVGNLSDRHPVAILVRRHFEGMPFINAQVPILLTPPGGWFDVLSAPTVPSMNDFISRHLDDFSFKAAALPQQFTERETNSASALPHYPYRDDGMLIWNAISAWITDFVGAFYASDARVRSDTALQSFAAGVRLKDFGPSGGIPDRQSLVEVLTTLVWITGPQHAAVNFSQRDWMSFLPAAPMFGCTPEPTGSGHSEQDWMANLPPADVALLSAGAATLLTAARTTRLGDYGLDFALFPAAAAAARRFGTALRDAETTIEGRNAARGRPYPYLLPSQVPSSISI
ncbi:lipoxygenase family protein [Streptomyces lavendulae]|uniref:lipoxygenase family protein n=1 Tax=Streptomyces lavendulae TaxID=1914 RepID=UPI0038240954